ncbi:MAG: phosphotransferase [Phycisphaerales bacterium]|nr:phosphotransferase [Phycisphaerales bacterium]
MPISRQQLSQREIDAVLSEYNLGKTHSVSELAAGSVYSPKVIVESDRGRMLLKRRARGLDIPILVAFSHQVILGCLEQGICVPPLLGTKDHNSLVQFEDQVYELFVFIEGTVFDRSPSMISKHAHEAGALLGEVHQKLDSVSPTFEAPVEPETIDLARIQTINRLSNQFSNELKEQLSRIFSYGGELAKANAGQPKIVHGDWHPGNMIFRGEHIVAVCDFDNTRLGSRAREVAQAMIHFSLRSPERGQRAQDCAPDPDASALVGFWDGYCTGAPDSMRCSLKHCLGLMPAVMLDEALASYPAQADSGAIEHADSMMIAVARKAVWLDQHQNELVSMLDSNS